MMDEPVDSATMFDKDIIFGRISSTLSYYVTIIITNNYPWHNDIVLTLPLLIIITHY